MLPIPADTAALLFDCDGTLADTMNIHFQAWKATMADHGVDLPRTFIDSHAGMPPRDIIAVINEEWGVELDPLVVANEKETRAYGKIHLAVPIEEVLSTARGYHGKLPMAVVSGGSRRMVHTILETIGAIDLFPVIVTADDPVPPKPSPEVFVAAARKLEVEPTKCHVFEDGDPGIIAARKAGMTYTDVRDLLRARAS